MKSFVKKIILFSLFFLVLNAMYLLALIKWDWNFAKRIEALSLENPKYECIIMGNSLAMDGIDPEILTSGQQSAYNLAIGGSSLKTNLIQLNEYLKIAGEKPKTVILGLGSYINDFKSEEINPIVEFTVKEYQFQFRDLPMIKFRWLIYELIKKVINPNHRNAKLNHGQLRIERIVVDDSDNTYPLPSIPLNDYSDSDYIKKIAFLCQSSEIKLILIEMPGFKKTQNQSKVGPHSISIDGNYNIDLYNFNNVHFVSKFNPKRDWLGNSHLNKYGATKFTKYLKEAIED